MHVLDRCSIDFPSCPAPPRAAGIVGIGLLFADSRERNESKKRLVGLGSMAKMAFEYTGGGVVENFVRRPESCLRANVTNEEHITTTDWFIEDTCGSNSSCGTCAADVLRSRGPSFCEKMRTAMLMRRCMG